MTFDLNTIVSLALGAMALGMFGPKLKPIGSKLLDLFKPKTTASEEKVAEPPVDERYASIFSCIRLADELDELGQSDQAKRLRCQVLPLLAVDPQENKEAA